MARGVTQPSFEEYDKYAKANVPGYGVGQRGGAVAGTMVETKVNPTARASATVLKYKPPVTSVPPVAVGVNQPETAPKAPISDNHIPAQIPAANPTSTVEQSGVIGDAAPVDNSKGSVLPEQSAQTPVTSGSSFGAFQTANSSNQNDFSTRANDLLGQEKKLMNDPSGGIGSGIVARGLANRATAFSAAGNAVDNTAINQQQTNNNALAQESQVAERAAESSRQDDQNARQAAESQSKLNADKITQDSASRIATLQDDYLNSPDPAKRAAAAEKINLLSGKAADPKFQPVMGKDDLGNPTYLGAFDSRTGNLTNNSVANVGARATAPTAAIEMLKNNPALAQQFKAKYGYLPQ